MTTHFDLAHTFFLVLVLSDQCTSNANVMLGLSVSSRSSHILWLLFSVMTPCVLGGGGEGGGGSVPSQIDLILHICTFRILKELNAAECEDLAYETSDSHRHYVQSCNRAQDI